MEIDFSPELLATIENVALEAGSDPVQLVVSIVQRYIDHDEWFRQQVQKGLVELDRREFQDHSQVVAYVDQLAKFQ